MILTNLSYLFYFSIIYMLGLIFLYYSKSRIKNIENRVYKWLLWLNIIGLILHICCDIVSYYYDVLPTLTSTIIYKLYIVYFIAWINTMLDYVLTISYSQKRKVVWFNIAITIIESIFIFNLPFELYRNISERVFYTHGVAVTAVFTLSAFMMIIMIAIVLKNAKKLKKKKLIPIFIFIACGVITFVIQRINPSVNILAPMESFLCAMMYFTIENPDLQMAE